MKKFMALYMAPAAMISQMMKMPPEQAKDGMAEWTKWSTKSGKAVVDLGMPLGKTKTVSPSGVSNTTNDITGYSIVQADNADAAAALFRDHPHLRMGKGATIDIIELVQIPGM